MHTTKTRASRYDMTKASTPGPSPSKSNKPKLKYSSSAEKLWKSEDGTLKYVGNSDTSQLSATYSFVQRRLSETKAMSPKAEEPPLVPGRTSPVNNSNLLLASLNIQTQQMFSLLLNDEKRPNSDGGCVDNSTSTERLRKREYFNVSLPPESSTSDRYCRPNYNVYGSFKEINHPYKLTLAQLNAHSTSKRNTQGASSYGKIKGQRGRKPKSMRCSQGNSNTGEGDAEYHDPNKLDWQEDFLKEAWQLPPTVVHNVNYIRMINPSGSPLHPLLSPIEQALAEPLQGFNYLDGWEEDKVGKLSCTKICDANFPPSWLSQIYDIVYPEL